MKQLPCDISRILHNWKRLLANQIQEPVLTVYMENMENSNLFFFKISLFEFLWRKKVIQVWNEIRVSKLAIISTRETLISVSESPASKWNQTKVRGSWQVIDVFTEGFSLSSNMSLIQCHPKWIGKSRLIGANLDGCPNAFASGRILTTEILIDTFSCSFCRGYYIVVVPLKKQRPGKFIKLWDNPDEMNLEEVTDT